MSLLALDPHPPFSILGCGAVGPLDYGQVPVLLCSDLRCILGKSPSLSPSLLYKCSDRSGELDRMQIPRAATASVGPQSRDSVFLTRPLGFDVGSPWTTLEQLWTNGL